jgi:hypothetical protein
MFVNSPLEGTIARLSLLLPELSLIYIKLLFMATAKRLRASWGS